jgi:uncharacterized protein
MASIDVLADDVSLDEPTMVEGLPGVGLVGKIAADHMVEEFEMTHYANVHCESVPPLAVYHADDSRLRTPVRIYADEARDLLVLQSDVPVSPPAATAFADCLAPWFADRDVVPLYLSGLAAEKDDAPPALYGVATGEGHALLDRAGLDAPAEMGVVSGPTGALLNDAIERDTTAVGLIVEADQQFPDPEAARVVIEHGIAPISGVDVPVEDLVDHAEEIREAKERFAQRMQEADEESSQAQPIRMYQ